MDLTPRGATFLPASYLPTGHDARRPVEGRGGPHWRPRV